MKVALLAVVTVVVKVMVAVYMVMLQMFLAVISGDS